MKGSKSDKKCVCAKCGKVYKSLSHLREHETNMHSKCRPYACSKCGKKFKRLTTLRVHQRIHGTPEYTCPHCHRKFYQKINLEMHMSKVCNVQEEAVKREREEREDVLRRELNTERRSSSDMPVARVAVLNPKRAMEILNNINHSSADLDPVTSSLCFTRSESSSTSCSSPDRLPKVDHNTETILKYLKESPDSTKNKTVNTTDSSNNRCSNEAYTSNSSELFQAVQSISATSDHNYIVSPTEIHHSGFDTLSDHMIESVSQVTNPVSHDFDHVTCAAEMTPESCSQSNFRIFNIKNENQTETQSEKHTLGISATPKSKVSGIVVKETILSSSCPNLELRPAVIEPRETTLKCKEEKVRENLIYLINLMMEKRSRKLARTKVRNLLAETDAEKQILRYIQSHNQHVVPAINCDVGGNYESVKFDKLSSQTSTQFSGKFDLSSCNRISDTLHTTPQLVNPPSNQIVTSISSNQIAVSHCVASNPSPTIIPALDSSGKTYTISCSTDSSKPRNLRPVVIKHIRVDDADKMNKMPIYSSQAPEQSVLSNVTLGTPSQTVVLNGSQLNSCAYLSNSCGQYIPETSPQIVTSSCSITYSRPSQHTAQAKRTLRTIRPKPTPVFYVASPNSNSNFDQMVGPAMQNGITVSMVSTANTGITLTPVSQVNPLLNSGITVTPVSKVNSGLALDSSFSPQKVSSMLESASKQSSQSYRTSNIAILPKLATEEIESRYTKIKPKPPKLSDPGVTVTPVVVNSTFAIPEPPKLFDHLQSMSDNEMAGNISIVSATDSVEHHSVSIQAVENINSVLYGNKSESEENRMDIVLASVNSLSNDSISSKQEDLTMDKATSGKHSQFLHTEDSESYDFLSASKVKLDQQNIHSSELHTMSEVAIDNTEKYCNLNQNTHNDKFSQSTALPLSFRQVIGEAQRKDNIPNSDKSPDKTMEQFIAKAPDSYFSTPEKVTQHNANRLPPDPTGLIVLDTCEISSKEFSTDLSVSPQVNSLGSGSAERKIETTPTSQTGDSPEVKRYQASPVKALDVDNSNLSTASQGELWEILQSLLKDIPKQISPGKNDGQPSGRIGFSPIKSESRLGKTHENETESAKLPWRVGFSPIKYLPQDLDVASAINLAGIFGSVSGTQLEVSPNKTTTNSDTSPPKTEHGHKRQKTSKEDHFEQPSLDIPTSDLERPARLNSHFRNFDPDLGEVSGPLMGETAGILSVSDNRKERTESDDVMQSSTVIGPDLIDENTMDKIIRVVEDLRALSNSNQ